MNILFNVIGLPFRLAFASVILFFSGILSLFNKNYGIPKDSLVDMALWIWRRDENFWE